MDYFNKLPIWAKAIIVFIVLLIIYKIVSKIIADYQINSKLAEQRKHYTVPVYDANGNPLPTQTGTQMYFDGSAAAKSFYDSIYDYGWFFGYGEDEAGMLAAINSVPTGYMPIVETAYTKLYKKNMQDDAISYLSNSDWQTVKSRFDEK